MSLDGFAITTVGKNDYKVIFWFMIKTRAVNRMENADLSEKRGQL